MKVIYYDLQTSHFLPVDGPDGAQIVQIGAVSTLKGLSQEEDFGQDRFNIYLIPTCSISDAATKKHGLTHENLLEAEIETGNVFSTRTGLEMFMNFLENQKDSDDEEILLVSVYFHFLTIQIKDNVNFCLYFPKWYSNLKLFYFSRLVE